MVAKRRRRSDRRARTASEKTKARESIRPSFVDLLLGERVAEGRVIQRRMAAANMGIWESCVYTTKSINMYDQHFTFPILKQIKIKF